MKVLILAMLFSGCAKSPQASAIVFDGGKRLCIDAADCGQIWLGEERPTCNASSMGNVTRTAFCDGKSWQPCSTTDECIVRSAGLFHADAGFLLLNTGR